MFPAMNPDITYQTERGLLRRYAVVIGFALIGKYFLSDLLVLLFQALLSVLYTAAPAVFLFEDELLQACNIILSFAIDLIPALIILTALRLPVRSVVPHRRLSPGLTLASVGVSLGASVIGVTMSGILVQFTFEAGLSPAAPDFTAPLSIPAYLLYAVNMTVVPALSEEFFYRGALMQTLRRFGDGFALLVSSLIFAIAHTNFYQLPNAFLMGLCIGYFVLLTGSFWTGVLIHFINNLFSVLADLAMANMTEAAADMLWYMQEALYLAAGLIALVWLLRKRRRLFTVAPSDCPLPEREKRRGFLLCVPMIIYFVLIAAEIAGTLF